VAAFRSFVSSLERLGDRHRGSILFLETWTQAYQIDRMLTQLRLAGSSACRIASPDARCLQNESQAIRSTTLPI